jgi:hypothetical protein
MTDFRCHLPVGRSSALENAAGEFSSVASARPKTAETLAFWLLHFPALPLANPGAEGEKRCSAGALEKPFRERVSNAHRCLARPLAASVLAGHHQGGTSDGCGLAPLWLRQPMAFRRPCL